MAADWDPIDARPERPPVPDPGGRFVRFDRDALRLVALIGAAAVVVAAVWLVKGRSEAVSASVPAHPTAASPMAAPLGPSGAPTPTSVPPSGTGGGTVTVDVRGAVQSPGVQRLPAGSRVIDAVRAAGGVRPGRGYGPLNLAEVLVDGEQIVVGGGRPAPPAATAPAGTAPSGVPPSGQGLVNLNTATAADLEALDGIGPVLAGNIIDWRTANGPFRSVEDLLDVSGIGEQTLAGMRDQVTVG